MDILTSSLDQLDLSWPPLSTHKETGGSPILSYNLQMLENGSWINVRGEDGDEVTSTQEVVYGLTENTEYTFRVRAKNVQGWSLNWSDEFTFITASIPEQPATISTSLENLKIRVAW